MASSTPGILDPNTKILIVDDSTQYATVLTKMLQHVFSFRNILRLESSQEALARIEAEPDAFQLLFVDFRFPDGFTGGELLQKLKQKNLLAGKVAFLITSEPSAENVKQAVQAGAYGVVAKPFDRNELKRQLEKAERTLQGDAIESF